MSEQHPGKSRCRAADDPRLVFQEHKDLAALTGLIHIALDRHATPATTRRTGLGFGRFWDCGSDGSL